MVAPKPIKLTQVDADDYQGADPKPYVVIGPIPGGGGGGGAVDSVNGKTGAVNLTASDVGAATSAQGTKADNAVPVTRTVNGKPLSADVNLSASDVGASTLVIGTTAGTAADAAAVSSALGNKADSSALAAKANTADVVPNTRKVNGKALSSDVTLAAADLSAVPTSRTVNGKALSSDVTIAAADLGAVPDSRAINGKALSADITLTASDLSAVPTSTTINSKPLTGNVTLAAADVSAVPTTRSVNGKPLSSDVTLTAADVGASTLVIGTTAGTAADAAETTAELAGKLDSGYAGAVAGTRFTVLYNSGWPSRPTTRTDVFVDWEDTTGTGTSTPSDIVLGDRVIRLSSTPPGPTLPTTDGWVTVRNGASVSSVTVDPTTPSGGTALQTGDWMLMTFMGAIGAAPATPSGWTVMADAGHFGTRYAIVWGKMRESGDSTYTFAIDSATNGSQTNLIWGTGANVSTWDIGTVGLRTSAAPATTIAPSVTTTNDSSVALTIGFEATTGTETDVTSLTGATEWFFVQQGTSPEIHTLVTATKEMDTAGATGDVTIVYPNASTSPNYNGAGVQFGIPPIS